MKKIMFKDRYGLTQAVLSGRKTMTRRPLKIHGMEANDIDEALALDRDKDANKKAVIKKYARYQIGEEVAIAESYEAIANSQYRDVLGMMDSPTTFKKEFCGPGWSNKMFVKADLMPHAIHITDIKVERLQDISEEDAMREGIFHYEKPPLYHEMDRFAPWPPYMKPYKCDLDNLKYMATARDAFAYLIDKVSGTGTWRSNPWVFAYSFELI
ncbi:MAG: hypothetical protein IJ197_08815 [Bacteroidaceae bacterium]|nr:hypothetical protein [Bacteroidaceae bacterium]